MRDLKFACPHCGQHIQCEDTVSGRQIVCPACGKEVAVPGMPDEHHLRLSTGRVPIPTHAHGAPRAGEVPDVPLPPPKYSRLAIASLTFSCASVLLWPLGFVPGIVCGYLARAEIKHNNRLLGDAIARAGIMVGYAFMGLLALAIAVGITLRIGGWLPRQ